MAQARACGQPNASGDGHYSAGAVNELIQGPPTVGVTMAARRQARKGPGRRHYGEPPINPPCAHPGNRHPNTGRHPRPKARNRSDTFPSRGCLRTKSARRPNPRAHCPPGREGGTNKMPVWLKVKHLEPKWQEQNVQQASTRARRKRRAHKHAHAHTRTPEPHTPARDTRQ